jgi:hypothetical protein
MSNTATTSAVSDLQLKFFRALERMRSNEVPESDRNGGSLEPVTVGGWYEVPTKTGRQAWARYVWFDGQLVESHCTYNFEHYKRADELVTLGADPFAKDE